MDPHVSKLLNEVAHRIVRGDVSIGGAVDELRRLHHVLAEETRLAAAIGTEPGDRIDDVQRQMDAVLGNHNQRLEHLEARLDTIVSSLSRLEDTEHEEADSGHRPADRLSKLENRLETSLENHIQSIRKHDERLEKLEAVSYAVNSLADSVRELEINAARRASHWGDPPKSQSR